MLDAFNKLLDTLAIKNEELISHCERVAMYCYQFGKSLNLPSKECDILYMVGVLHDIGKIYVSDKFMQLYPLVSQAIINTYGEDYDEIAKIVSQHRENVDGTGFPNQLTGKDVHLYAIILHICDFYDTARMNGNTHEETTVLIRKNTNIMFPKKIITPFIKSVVNGEDFYSE